MSDFDTDSENTTEEGDQWSPKDGDRRQGDRRSGKRRRVRKIPISGPDRRINKQDRRKEERRKDEDSDLD